MLTTASGPGGPTHVQLRPSAAYLGTVPESDLDRLRDENTELRRRVEQAEAELAELRTESLARRAEVRRLVEALPAATSRKALLRALVGDLPGQLRRRIGRARRR